MCSSDLRLVKTTCTPRKGAIFLFSSREAAGFVTFVAELAVTMAPTTPKALSGASNHCLQGSASFPGCTLNKKPHQYDNNEPRPGAGSSEWLQPLLCGLRPQQPSTLLQAGWLGAVSGQTAHAAAGVLWTTGSCWAIRLQGCTAAR